MTFDKILIPLIRKVLPQQIAYDITGVQPMKSRTIFSDLADQRTPPRELFNHFLRLNNRKRVLTLRDFQKAGYPFVTLTIEIIFSRETERDEWLCEVVGAYNYYYFDNVLFFENENLKTLYLLRWSSD